jgi:lysophospholipase L1-like esterase
MPVLELVPRWRPTPRLRPMAKARRFLFLGDSYTIGESLPSAESWPAQYCARLAKAGQRVSSQIIAQTGWTTDELAQAIDAAALVPPFDFVSLLIGVNNQYRKRSLREYAAHFALLLANALALAGGENARVCVLSIPDWGNTPFGRNDARGARRIGLEVDAFNGIASSICRAAAVRFVDITPCSRASDPALVAPDGLHPSAKAYRQWLELL